MGNYVVTTKQFGKHYCLFVWSASQPASQFGFRHQGAKKPKGFCSRKCERGLDQSGGSSGAGEREGGGEQRCVFGGGGFIAMPTAEPPHCVPPTPSTATGRCPAVVLVGQHRGRPDER